MIRPATHEDIPAIRAILAAHGNDGPIENADIVGPYVSHFIDHAIALVSEREGEVVAFGAAIETATSRHLADLFVRQDLLGQRIGGPLLGAVLAGAPRRTTFASEDPRAMPLYIRSGMRPLWPMLYLRGDGSRLPEPGHGPTIESADPGRLAELEREWTGIDRSTDHRHWGRTPDVDGFVVVGAGGSPLALGHARVRQTGTARILDRLIVRPGAGPVEPTLAAIRRAARGGPIVVAVPGPNPILSHLLEAGFRIEDHDTFMASEPGLVDPERMLPNSGML